MRLLLSRDRFRFIKSSQQPWTKVLSFLFLITLGFLISSPLSAGPDEPEHQSTAWYYIHHAKPVTTYHQLISGIPSQLIVPPCFASDSSLSAKCQLQEQNESRELGSFKINNYPPLPYWIVGIGQLVIQDIDAELMSFGGRLFLMFACFLLLIGSFRLLSKSGNGNLFFLVFLSCSPMALFLAATANPSGLEITASLAFASALIHYVNLPNTRSIMFIFLTGTILAMSRPISFLWLSVITIFFIFFALNDRSRNDKLRVILAVTPGISFGIYWRLVHPTFLDWPGYVPEKVDNQALYLIESFLRSINLIPTRLEQSWGILGWLDTHPLQIVWFLVVVFWSWFLLSTLADSFSRMVRPLIFVFSTLILISILEASANQQWPEWWQGRYQIPVFGALLLLMLKLVKVKFGLSGYMLFIMTILFNSYMLVLNFARYNWGVQNGLPVNVLDNSFSMPRISLFCAVMLALCVNVVLIFRDKRLKINADLWN